MITCAGCGEKFIWFCGGPETIVYPKALDCPTCGVVNIDPGPPNWRQVRYTYVTPTLDQDWDD